MTQRDEAKRPTPTTAIFLWSNRLFSLLAAGSALLLVVVVAVWVRSYFAVDVIRYQPGIEDALRGYAVGWGKGYVATIAEPAKRPAPLGVQWQSLPAAPFDRMWAARNEIFHLLGVRVSSGVGQMNRQVRGLSVHLPCWVPALLSACLPAIWLTTRWRARRLVAPRLEGRHCVRCGYHRCATPDRCPECNSAAAA